ncbi:hypothetical protein E1200_13090 [Actinomadura sp. GC306]|nr:hypothetical protein E1200_13090 [Actinomadura sp. GC306]
MAAVGVGVRGLRSPPRRGEPDFRKRCFDQYFHSIGTMLVGSIFVGTGVAALIFGYDSGVPSQREFLQWVSFALLMNLIMCSWRWIRRRRRP